MIIFGLVVLETEIYVQVIIRTEHVEIFGIKRFIRKRTFLFVLEQTDLFVTSGFNTLVVEQIVYAQAESECVGTVYVPVLSDAGIHDVCRIKLLLTSDCVEHFRIFEHGGLYDKSVLILASFSLM